MKGILWWNHSLTFDYGYLAYPLPQKAAASAFGPPSHAPPSGTHIVPITGGVLLFDTVKLEVISVVETHKSPLSCTVLDNEGTILRTASDKGTIIRVFSATETMHIFKLGRQRPSVLKSRLLQIHRRASSATKVYFRAANRQRTRQTMARNRTLRPW
jgi:hypothetical protein